MFLLNRKYLFILFSIINENVYIHEYVQFPNVIIMYSNMNSVIFRDDGVAYSEYFFMWAVV